MPVVAPSTDAPGALIDASIATVQALVNANANPAVLPALELQLNQLQIEAVDHYMTTGWVNPTAILAVYSPPSWDAVGQALALRVTQLTNFLSGAPPNPPGNSSGYGGAGWTNTFAQSFARALYVAQSQLVDHIMALPGGTSAATILANLTGTQTTPDGNAYNPQAQAGFEYVFDSVGWAEPED